MTDRESRAAEEILRLARDELGYRGPLEAGSAPLAGQLDSLVLLSLVVAVEDRFRIVLADDDAATTRTLQDLARLVAARAGPEALP